MGWYYSYEMGTSSFCCGNQRSVHGRIQPILENEFINDAPWVQLENDSANGAQGDNYHQTNYLFNVEPTKEKLEVFYSKSKALDRKLHGSCECQVVS
jgi:hypothetical protein